MKMCFITELFPDKTAGNARSLLLFSHSGATP